MLCLVPNGLAFICLKFQIVLTKATTDQDATEPACSSLNLLTPRICLTLENVLSLSDSK